ncbi:hypothetical protein LMG22037_05498 [Paraburkholderia phenoliruptrix]|uniref:Uncharacterized protein n=1 Tax=Paraburkholderia phenoliruptrix TaxID=252970 RepID=A0A6J5C7Z5_9BURK|nr:hypothetical protein LMG22037_05498 [Paraburkholderia phenoliruptrix]
MLGFDRFPLPGTAIRAGSRTGKRLSRATNPRSWPYPQAATPTQGAEIMSLLLVDQRVAHTDRVCCPSTWVQFRCSVQKNALRYAWKLSTGVSGIFKPRRRYTATGYRDMIYALSGAVSPSHPALRRVTLQGMQCAHLKTAVLREWRCGWCYGPAGIEGVGVDSRPCVEVASPQSLYYGSAYGAAAFTLVTTPFTKNCDTRR